MTRIGSNTASPDESVKNSPHGVIGIFKNVFGGGTRMQDTLLALSIVVNIVMIFMYMHLAQVVDLDRYDDNTFINGRFSDLKSKVDTHDALIQTYGLQKALKEK